jgi:hypothetical protein
MDITVKKEILAAVGVRVKIDTTIKLGVVIQVLTAGTDITVKKEILAAAGVREGIQVMRAEAARTRTGKAGQETLIR